MILQLFVCVVYVQKTPTGAELLQCTTFVHVLMFYFCHREVTKLSLSFEKKLYAHALTRSILKAHSIAEVGIAGPVWHDKNRGNTHLLTQEPLWINLLGHLSSWYKIPCEPTRTGAQALITR